MSVIDIKEKDRDHHFIIDDLDRELIDVEEELNRDIAGTDAKNFESPGLKIHVMELEGPPNNDSSMLSPMSKEFRMIEISRV